MTQFLSYSGSSREEVIPLHHKMLKLSAGRILLSSLKEFQEIQSRPRRRELLKSLVQSVTTVPALKPSAPSPMPSPAASPLPPMPVPVQSESSGAKTPENSGARRRTFEDQMDAASKILRPEITESSHPVKKSCLK